MPCAGKLPFSQAPEDRDNVQELHLVLNNSIIVFAQATKLAYCATWLQME
jgi:hypothetical protein